MLRFLHLHRTYEQMKRAQFSTIAFALTIVVGGTIVAVAQGMDQRATLDRQLLQAADDRDIGSVQRLLKSGANIEAKNRQGSTALIIAAASGNTVMVKFLLENGANVAASDNYHETALIQAARVGAADSVVALLGASSGVKEKNEALFAATEAGGPVVVISEDAEAKPNKQDGRAATEAPEPPWVSTVRVLLDSGADLEARDEDGETPLIRAASYGQTDIFRLLLQRGANLNARDKNGMTALIAAACECAVATMNSTYDIVRMLLEKGANANSSTRDGTTALMKAAGGFGEVAIVELLLDYRANPAVKNKEGDTALILAMKSDQTEKVLLLKKAVERSR
jgi:ankyrin repeat protein